MVGASASDSWADSSYKSSSSQEVFGEKAFRNMYGQANKLYRQQKGLNPEFQQFVQGQVNPFMQGLNPYMMQGFGQQMGGGMQGGAGQQINPALQQSLQQSLAGGQSNEGRMYEDIVGGAGNTYVDPVVDDMYSQAWKGMDRGKFKNTAAAAAQGNNMGNYARQMDNTQFASDTMSDLRSKELALRGSAYDTDLNWKMDIARQADSNLGAAQDRAIGLLGAGDQNQQFGVGQGLGMQQFGMGMTNPWMAMQQMPWANMNAWSNVLGDPTVLSRSDATGASHSRDISVGVGL